MLPGVWSICLAVLTTVNDTLSSIRVRGSSLERQRHMVIVSLVMKKGDIVIQQYTDSAVSSF